MRATVCVLSRNKAKIFRAYNAYPRSLSFLSCVIVLFKSFASFLGSLVFHTRKTYSKLISFPRSSGISERISISPSLPLRIFRTILGNFSDVLEPGRLYLLILGHFPELDAPFTIEVQVSGPEPRLCKQKIIF